jgi:signal transduction histidine kinase
LTLSGGKPKWLARLLAILLSVLCLLPAVCAADPSPPDLVLSGDAASFPLRGHIARLEDPAGTLKLDEAARSDAFAARPPDAEERNFASGAIWYRFTVVRPKDKSAEWILSIGEPYIDDIRVYTSAENGGFREKRLGRAVPNDQLPLAARRHVARLDLPEDVPTTVFVRLASGNEIEFMAELWHPDALLFVESRESMLSGMVLACSILVFAIYMFFGVWLRDGPLLAYAFYVATFTLLSVGHSGTFAMLFPGMGGRANDAVIGVGVAGNLAALAFMWDCILKLRRRFPVVHRLYLIVGWAALLSLLTLPTEWHLVAIRPAAVIGTVVTAVSMALAAARLRRSNGDERLKYYIVAFVPVLFFSLLRTADAIFPGEIAIMTIRDIGMVVMLFHIVILSFALGHHITLLQRERFRAEAEVSVTNLSMREYSNFVSMLSHQLRTPLAIILSTVDLLEMDLPSLQQTEKIRRAVKHMRDLTANVLADSRLTESVSTLKSERVPLAPLLASLVQECREHSLHRFRESLNSDCVVVGDRALLGILFANLLENADKYSPPEGEICVSLSRADGFASITIANGGSGIPPEEAERIYEKFYRSPSALSHPGTGLGLYLVNQIAHRHGGSVSLASQPGQGATFTVTLPLSSSKTIGGTPITGSVSLPNGTPPSTPA